MTIGDEEDALETEVRPPLPRLLALPLDLVLGTAGALLPSVCLSSLPVRLRVIGRDGTVLGGDGGFLGGGEEDEEDGPGGAGDREDGAEGNGGEGRVDGGSNADGEEDEEEEGIAAGEGTVGALGTGTGIGV